MITKKNSFYYLRLQKSYEKEIRYILQYLIEENDWPFFSVSHCLLSNKKAEYLKIFLFFMNKNDENLVTLLNQEYKYLINESLARSKKFRYLPKISFLLDQ